MRRLKDGDIHKETGAIYRKVTKGNDTRYYLQCSKCSYMVRPNEYDVNHKHIIDTTNKQSTLDDHLIRVGSRKELIYKIAEAAAIENISSNAIASKSFVAAFNMAIKYGYSLKENGKELDTISYTDKNITDSIVSIYKSDRSAHLRKFQEIGYTMVILDAGTVRTHHTLEIILVLPGLIDPLPYTSKKLKAFNIEEYKKIAVEIYQSLKENNLTLIGFCGDNLSSQKNGLDQTNNKSLQAESYKKQKEIEKIIECLMNEQKNEDILEKKKELRDIKGLSSLIYSPCLNHTVSLAFYDSVESCALLQEYSTKIDQYCELFKNKAIKDIIGPINFTVCKTRWIYLFEALLSLVRNQDKIETLYTILEGKSNKEVANVFDSPEYSEITERPEHLKPLINVLWPLHTFSSYLERNSTLLCYVLPKFNAVCDQLKSRGIRYDMIDVTNTIIYNLEERFKLTGRFELMQSSYFLTPIGRKDLLKNRQQYFQNEPFMPPEIEFFELTEENSDKKKN